MLYSIGSSEIKLASCTAHEHNVVPRPRRPVRRDETVSSVFRVGHSRFDCRGKMPFYQVLCIAAHNPEYVRDKPFFVLCLYLSFSKASNQKPRSPSRHAYSQQRRRRSRHSVLGHRNTSSTHAVAWNQSRSRRVCPIPLLLPPSRDLPLDPSRTATGRCILTHHLKSKKV